MTTASQDPGSYYSSQAFTVWGTPPHLDKDSASLDPLFRTSHVTNLLPVDLIHCEMFHQLFAFSISQLFQSGIKFKMGISFSKTIIIGQDVQRCNLAELEMRQYQEHGTVKVKCRVFTALLHCVGWIPISQTY